MVPRNSLFPVPVPSLDGQARFRNVAECIDEGCGKTAVREQPEKKSECGGTIWKISINLYICGIDKA